MKKQFNIDCELCYNPLILEEKKKPIILVSATRLSPIKGGERMKKLAEELDIRGTNYIWYIFTNEAESIHSNNVIFMKERLDVWRWIQNCDALVQLSDTEAMSYSINEALAYGKQVVVTPLPYLEEIGIRRNENAVILEFDCSNIKEVADQIENLKEITWKPPEDGYNKILVPSKSTYTERRMGMKRIKVKQKFLDMKHNNIQRRTGEEFIEENDRADDLINRGFCLLVEELTPKETPAKEVAVKTEAKKERAIKTEKETAKKKESKKNAPKE